MELHTGMTMHKEDNIGRLVQAAYKPAVPRPEFKERLLKRLQTVGSTSNRDEVVKLRETGLNYAEIGRRVGITRERVRQILNEGPGPQKPVGQPKVMLTISDVAHLLGLHHNTVRRWSKRGILKSYRIGARGDRRFKREDIDRFLKEAETPTKDGED